MGVNSWIQCSGDVLLQHGGCGEGTAPLAINQPTLRNGACGREPLGLNAAGLNRHRPPGAEFPRGRIPQGRKIPQGPIFCAADLHFELERTGQKSVIPGIEDNWSKTGNPISEPQIPSLQHVKNVCSKISEMSFFVFMSALALAHVN